MSSVIEGGYFIQHFIAANKPEIGSIRTDQTSSDHHGDDDFKSKTKQN